MLSNEIDIKRNVDAVNFFLFGQKRIFFNFVSDDFIRFFVYDKIILMSSPLDWSNGMI